MPNQLTIPFKKTYAVPLREAVRQYILSNYKDNHPDAYKWDIAQWESLRKDGTGGTVHVDRVKSSVSYHAQLVFVLTKLPADIGLEIPYAPLFDPSALPLSLNNLVYERVGVLMNLAALQSQLGAAEDRSTLQGLKQAMQLYQTAAGTLHHLASPVLSQLAASIAPHEVPEELTEAFVASLEYLMLAQAQECVWQRAVLDNYKNAVIARLAAGVGVASLYGEAVKRIQEASPPVKHVFPPLWVPHLEAKQLHFQAASQYRKSVDDLEANRYGEEVARLLEAQSLAKRGYDTARRGGVAVQVTQDVKSLLDNVQKSLSRAERDNDLIYHHDVPPTSGLPSIQEVSMVKPIVNPGLVEPKSVVGNESVIFGELLGWGARLAVDIYNDRKQNWLQEEVLDRARGLVDKATTVLRTLNLPTSLEALEKPIGLPPSLVKKAEEVRLENGPERIATSINDVRVLAKHNSALLDQAMDILDQEAEEDEALRAKFPNAQRLPSFEANQDLTGKEERYRAILQQAADSDETVRHKWEEWEDNIIQLTWNETDLETAIPSSTVSLSQAPSVSGGDPTRTHARALRGFLERLDDLGKARGEIVARAERVAASDDITSRVLKAASGMEQWVDVKPEMFEDILQAELAKYDKFRVSLDESDREQEELLESIEEKNGQFIRSRKEDTTVKERELAIQSLELAYQKYKEISRNLEEGLKFYNDLSAILSQFRDDCKGWASMRSHEANTLTLRARSIHPAPLEYRDGKMSQLLDGPGHLPAVPSNTPSKPTPRKTKSGFGLPPPDSDEWETMAMPPPPSRPEARTPKPAGRSRAAASLQGA